jgi:hypothetical protein
MPLDHQMADYWINRPQVAKAAANNDPGHSTSSAWLQEDSLLSEYDLHRQSLILQEADEEWSSEIRRYLKEVPADVTRATDIVKWWSDHAKVYPTLARIALDILPMQASSVPCERVFSAAKLIATDRRARLSPVVFEELQILKLAWRDRLLNWAALNAEDIDEIDEIDEKFVCHLAEDKELKEWEEEIGDLVITEY